MIRLSTTILVTVAACGCAHKTPPLAPTDDRLGSISELRKTENEHVDAAAKSNDDALAAIRKARQQLRQ